MTYEKNISRADPGLIVMVLDDSGSMGDNLPGTTDAKYKWVERYTGIIFKELLARSTDLKGDETVVKPRYFLYVVLYGSKPKPLTPQEVDIETAVAKFTETGNSLGLRGMLGGTDTAAALHMAHDFLRNAVTQDRFKKSFPPMVFHMTDGESHSDPTGIAEQIKQLSTTDGNVLVVNAYIGTRTSLNYSGSEDFPGYLDEAEAGPREDNLRLFQMSSAAPECVHGNLVSEGIFPNLRPGARLFFDVRTKDMLRHVIQLVSSIGTHAERMAR